jgi:hypothetical protein
LPNFYHRRIQGSAWLRHSIVRNARELRERRSKDFLQLGDYIMKYEYISYDVWGNDDDGYEVNQSFHTGEIVKIDPLDDDEGLIKSLQEQGFLIGAIDYDKL